MPRTSSLLVLLFSGTVAIGAEAPPKVIVTWAAGPLEARVAFDRAASPEVAKGLVGTRIVFGDDVKPGERFDPAKPGSSDVPSRGSLRIAAARLDDGGRTLVLATDPHAWDTTYALTLPDPVGASLTYRLRGMEFAWDDGREGSKPRLSGWWPSPNTAKFPAHLPSLERFDRERPSLGKPTRFMLKTQLALQKGKSAVTILSSAPFEVNFGGASAKSSPKPGGGYRAVVASEVESDVVDLSLTLRLDDKAQLSVAASYRGPGDAADRPIATERCILPWAPPLVPPPAPTPVPEGILSGGDPTKGALVFKGEQAKCATCHKVRGDGGEVGPDLSDLVHRDRARVYRDINEPSASIHPDYVSYTVLLRDGQVLAGIVRAEGADAIRVVNTEGTATTVQKAEIEELKPSATSIMPVGLLGAIGEAGVKDLIAFLTSRPPPKP